MTPLYRTSRPDHWTHPRNPNGWPRDQIHGALQGLPDSFYSDGFLDAVKPHLRKASWIVTSFAVGLCAVLAAYHVTVWFWG